jgi:hypothetical protein
MWNINVRDKVQVNVPAWCVAFVPLLPKLLQLHQATHLQAHHPQHQNDDPYGQLDDDGGT